jgi:hypothetical protein
LHIGWGLCDRLCPVLVCRGRYGFGGGGSSLHSGIELGRSRTRKGSSGEEEGGGVRSGPGSARTILSHPQNRGDQGCVWHPINWFLANPQKPQFLDCQTHPHKPRFMGVRLASHKPQFMGCQKSKNRVLIETAVSVVAIVPPKPMVSEMPFGTWHGMPLQTSRLPVGCRSHPKNRGFWYRNCGFCQEIDLLAPPKPWFPGCQTHPRNRGFGRFWFQ